LDLRKTDDKGIEHAMARLYNRPRKTLGFARPIEIFFNDIRNKNTVACVI